ncbi:MAG: hypothetical protein SWI22_01440 [Pseudomonadota bacterium]|nr:hypothetical protein [Pseudomonadota bacterium]
MATIFEGDLVSLDGQDVRGSNLFISLVAGGEDREVPNHYFLSSGCRDHGFLDPADGRFWSGSTPEKNGKLADDLRKRGRGPHCLVDDVARYHRLVALMEEGAVLSFAPDHSSATFTTPSNRVAEFNFRPSMMID